MYLITNHTMAIKKKKKQHRKSPHTDKAEAVKQGEKHLHQKITMDPKFLTSLTWFFFFFALKKSPIHSLHTAFRHILLYTAAFLWYCMARSEITHVQTISAHERNGAKWEVGHIAIYLTKRDGGGELGQGVCRRTSIEGSRFFYYFG